jgi:hypothetical protein
MCSVCLKTPCDYRCPNAPDPEHIYECEFCDGGITSGEDFVEIDCKYYHKDCLSVDDLLELLDIDVQVAIGEGWL